MKNSYFKFMLLLSFLLITISPFQTTNAENPDNEPLKIGVVLALTGPAKVWSEQSRFALEIARDDINSSGGIAGRQVKLIFEDSKTEPKNSVQSFQKLVNQEKIKVVIGDVWNFITMPLIPLATRSKVTLLSPSFVDYGLTEKSPYFFTLGAKIDHAQEAIDRFFEKNPKVKKVFLVNWDDTWGKSYQQQWKASAERHQVTVVKEMQNGDWNTDYRLEAAKIKEVNPDAVFVTHYSERLIRALKELQFLPTMLTSSNCTEALNTGTISYKDAEGLYFTDFKPSDSFREKFKAKAGYFPILEASSSYDSLWVIKKAIENSPDDIPAGIRKLSYDGTAGKIDFTKTFTGNFAKFELFQVRNGEVIKVN